MGSLPIAGRRERGNITGRGSGCVASLCAVRIWRVFGGASVLSGPA